jgi:leader peptidase (prepilin peptidase)/N-methyltransferase
MIVCGAAGVVVFAIRPAAAAAVYAVALSAVIAAAVVDAAEQRLPNVLTIGSGLLALLGLGTVTIVTGDGSIGRAAAGMAIFGGWTLAGALLVAAGYGLGDIKLASTLGILFAWQSWATLAAGVLVCQLAVAAALIVGRVRGSSEVALGPAFVTGAAAVLAGAAFT